MKERDGPLLAGKSEHQTIVRLSMWFELKTNKNKQTNNKTKQKTKKQAKNQKRYFSSEKQLEKSRGREGTIPGSFC